MAISIQPNHFVAPRISDKISDNEKRLIPENYQKVASDMESQFAEQMIEEMNKSIHKADEEDSSSASQFYDSLLNSERAKSMTKNGLGISDMVLNQIYPKRMRNEITYRQMTGHAPKPEIKESTTSVGQNKVSGGQL